MNEQTDDADLMRYLAMVRKHLKFAGEEQSLPMDAGMEDLGLDSVTALNLMLDLEEAYGVVFDESLFTEETFATPRALWLALSSLRS